MKVSRKLFSYILMASVLFCVSGVDIYFSRAGFMAGGSLLGIVLILLCFGAILAQNKGRIYLYDLSAFPQYALGVFCVFLAWALCSVFYSPEINLAALAFFRYSLYLIVAMLIGLLSLIPMYKPVVCSGIMLALYVVCGSIWVDVIYPRRFFSEGSRPAGIMMNPNAAAQSATMLLLLGFILLRSTKVLMFALALTCLSVLVTLSRSGILLLAISVMSGFYLRTNSGFNFNFGKIIVSAFLLLLTTVFGFSYLSSISNTTLSNRVEFMFSGGGLVDLNDPRVQLATKYFDIWLQNPIFGYGTASTYGGEFDVMGATHNLYLKILVENGIIGLMLFLLSLLVFMLGSCVRHGIGYILPWGLVAGWAVFANGLLDNRLFYVVVVLIALSPSIMRISQSDLDLGRSKGAVNVD